MTTRRIAFVGRVDSLASQFINFIIGDDILPTDVDATCPTVVTASDGPAGSILSPPIAVEIEIPGTETTRTIFAKEEEARAHISQAYAAGTATNITVRRSNFDIQEGYEFVFMPPFGRNPPIDLSAYKFVVCMKHPVLQSVWELFRHGFAPNDDDPRGIVFYNKHAPNTRSHVLRIKVRMTHGVHCPVYAAWTDKKAREMIAMMCRGESGTVVSSPIISVSRACTPPRLRLD